MNKVELLAPAGDLNRLYIAFMYGADAVYVGMKSFSLRSAASNFSKEDILEGCSYAHSINKKLYVTMNNMPLDSDLENLNDYLTYLESIKIDALIVSSLGLINYISTKTNIPIHYSTQGSLANVEAINFLKNYNVKRVVCARELDLDGIIDLQKNTPIPLEIFIHGGMCMSFSGRCRLSNYQTDRDANRGGCAHSCRWNYKLYENSQIINEEFSIASKDLCGISYIEDLVKIGVESLKIEGRMKSPHYLATVINVYRKLIDDIIANDINDLSYYQNLISKAENRETWAGYIKGDTFSSLIKNKTETPNQIYVGIVNGYDPLTNLLCVTTKNYFKVGDTLEIFTPTEYMNFVLTDMRDADDNQILLSNTPEKQVFIKCNCNVVKNSFVRKIC